MPITVRDLRITDAPPTSDEELDRLRDGSKSSKFPVTVAGLVARVDRAEKTARALLRENARLKVENAGLRR